MFRAEARYIAATRLLSASPPVERTVSTTKIVLIEDDEPSQYFYGTILRRAGYTVLPARFGKAGLKLAKDEAASLVVVDLGLPEMDGLEVIRALKADPATRHIPLVVVTVHVFEKDRDAAFEAGCDEFLEKPLPPSELLAAVQRTLERCARPPGMAAGASPAG